MDAARYPRFQAGAELMQHALNGKVQRVPVYAQMHEFVAHRLAIPNKLFYTRADIQVPAMLAVQEEFDLDVASLSHDVYNIEAEGLGQPLIFDDDCVPDVDRTRPLIRDKDDLRKIKTPDFERSGRFDHVVEMVQIFRQLTGLKSGPGFTAPFSLAANIRGIEQLITDIYSDPDFANDLFTRINHEVLAPYLHYLRRYFPDLTSFSAADATASIPIVNLKMLDDWCARPILQLRELTGLDIHVQNWVGERYLKHPRQMLELKRKVTSITLQGQDPDVAALGPAFFRNYADEFGMPLVLGIGASFLAQAKPEEIRERVTHYVKTGGKDGHFALYLCNISGATPPENLRAAVDAAHSVSFSQE